MIIGEHGIIQVLVERNVISHYLGMEVAQLNTSGVTTTRAGIRGVAPPLLYRN